MKTTESSNGAPEALAGDRTVDLDQFLDVQGSQQNNGSTSDGDSFNNQLPIPETDRMAIVGIFVDDSTSMTKHVTAVHDGLKLSVDAFRGAKGSDFYLGIQGFESKNYFSGMLKDVTDEDLVKYRPWLDATPLIRNVIGFIGKLRELGQRYTAMGIPTTVALLIITDGLPDDDHDQLIGSFAEHAQSIDYLVAMGIARENDEGYIKKYLDLFEKMQIEKVVTVNSNAAEIRHAINQFSQSVAAVVQTA